uniref:BsrBI n=1 Tax=Geobacillus stearothermophilus TaxID=1422 RepID=E5Q8U6_GEOSE|nr:BsrBI [Geobacillus stearothermophilus]
MSDKVNFSSNNIDQNYSIEISEFEFGTGRIADIIRALKDYYGVESLENLTHSQKLDGLCKALQFTPSQLDRLIAQNSPVLRTIKGHAFERVFDEILKMNGYEVTEVGGDSGVDRIVNNKTLQLKTPNKAGTKENVVEYKTHKTHGAKSERESLDYYYSKEDFADYLVGLVSYEPFNILFIPREELPTISKDSSKIKSPFKVEWDSNPGLNSFKSIGIDNIVISEKIYKPAHGNELLPLSSRKLQLKSEIIIDVILNESNFRIWDMNMRGFAREMAFVEYLSSFGIRVFNPANCRKERADKADIALKSAQNGNFSFLQIKGITLDLDNFRGRESIVDVETQLSRGRVNDHPTQSRLYLETDFDYLIVCIDPCYSKLYSKEIGKPNCFDWEFYAIPNNVLERHPKYTRRIKSHQKIKYVELQRYRIDDTWINLWEKGAN